MAATLELEAREYNQKCEYWKALEAYLKALKKAEEEHGAASGHPAIASCHYNIGLSMLSLGKIQEAVAHFSTATNMREEYFGVSDEHVGQAHLGLAIAYHKQGDFKKALNTFNTASEIFNATESEDATIAEKEDLLGGLQVELGQYTRAKTHLDNALSIYKKMFNTESNGMACTIYITLAQVNSTVNAFQKAIEANETAINIAKTLLPKGVKISADLGISYNALANSYISQGDYKLAKKANEDAINVFSQLWGENTNRMSMIYAKITQANLHNKRGAWKIALTAYSEALRKLRKCFGDNANHPLMADVLDCIGQLSEDLCQFRAAKNAYNNAYGMRDTAYNNTDSAIIHPAIANGNDRVASLLCKRGKYQKALQLSLRSLRERVKSYGDMGVHPCIARNHEQIGSIYVLLCHYQEALDSHKDSLGVWTQLFGQYGDHSEIARANMNIGNVYRLQCKYDKAIKYHRRALKQFECIYRAMGVHHDYADVHCALASVYEDQGAYQEALKSYEKAHEIRLSQLDDSHPDIPRTMASMANVYFKMGKYESARTKFSDAVHKFHTIYGDTARHADVAACYERIGTMHLERGKFDEAREYFARSSGNYTDIYGRRNRNNKLVQHPDLARLQDDLGKLYLLEQKDLTEAWARMSQSLTMRISLHGEEEGHMDIAASYFSIGGFHLIDKDYASAITAFNKSLKVIESVCGTYKQLKVVEIYTKLGEASEGENLDADAIKYYKKAVQVVDAVCDQKVDDKNAAVALYNLGRMLKQMSERRSAYPHYCRAMGIFERLLEEDKKAIPILANIYNDLGMIGHNEMGADAADTMKYYRQAMELLTEHSPSHSQLGTIYENIGLLNFYLCKYEAALQFHKKSLENRQKYNPDEDTVEVAEIYDNIGQVMNRTGHYQSALEYYQKSLQIKKNVHGEDGIHTDIAQSYSLIGATLERAGESKSSFEKHIDALTIYRSIHKANKNHPDVARAHYSIGLSLVNQGDCKRALDFFTTALRKLSICYDIGMGKSKSGEAAVSTRPHGWLYSSECCQYIGLCYYKQHDHTQALDYFGDAIAMLELNSEQHPDIAVNWFHIGRVHVDLHEFDEAQCSFTKALEEWQIFFNKHPDMAICYRVIGGMHELQGKYDEAMTHYKTSLEMMKVFDTEDDKWLISIYEDMANICHKQGKWSDNVEYLYEILRLKKAVFGDVNHIEIANALEAIGDVYIHLGDDPKKGKQFLDKAKKMRAAVHGKPHPKTR